MIQLTINNSSNNEAYFWFGLILSEHKDTKHIGSHAYYFECRRSSNNNTQIIKGRDLHSNGSKKIGKKRLEFRINIS